jgi:hypothetical protein
MKLDQSFIETFALKLAQELSSFNSDKSMLLSVRSAGFSVFRFKRTQYVSNYRGSSSLNYLNERSLHCDFQPWNRAPNQGLYYNTSFRNETSFSTSNQNCWNTGQTNFKVILMSSFGTWEISLRIVMRQIAISLSKIQKPRFISDYDGSAFRRPTFTPHLWSILSRCYCWFCQLFDCKFYSTLLGFFAGFFGGHHFMPSRVLARDSVAAVDWRLVILKLTVKPWRN